MPPAAFKIVSLVSTLCKVHSPAVATNNKACANHLNQNLKPFLFSRQMANTSMTQNKGNKKAALPKKLKNKSASHAPEIPAELETAKVSLLSFDQPGSKGE